jgi:hypothetical protein
LFSFKRTRITPSHYTLRHYVSQSEHMVRSWALEGRSDDADYYNDGAESDDDDDDGGDGGGGGGAGAGGRLKRGGGAGKWTVLRYHSDDDAIKTAGGSHTWSIDAGEHGSETRSSTQVCLLCFMSLR